MKRAMALLAIMAILVSLLPGCTNSPERQLKELGYEISESSFLQSVTKGDTAAVNLFVATKISPDARDEVGLTALMSAANAGHFDVVKVLIDNKADVNAVNNEDGRSALHFAASKGYAEVISLLLSKGASVNALTKSGETALMLAAESEHDEAVKALIEGKADVNAARANDGYTALHLAAAKRTPAARGVREYETCKILLEAGASPSLSTNDGTTPLMIAVKNYDYSLAESLLERGAPVNAQNELGETALMLAVVGDSMEIIQLLIDRGAKLNLRTSREWTALDYAKGRDSLISLLQSIGAQYGDRQRQEWFKTEEAVDAFHAAVKAGDVKKARSYILQGVDPDHQTYPALVWAVQNEDREMILMLLDEGADINCGFSPPLMTAAYQGSLEIAKLLLDKGADVNYRSDYGAPINAAARENHLAVVELLLSRGAYVDSYGHYGETALITASYQGNLDMVKLLLSEGANADERTEWFFDEEGHLEVSPLMLAERCGYSEIADLLRPAVYRIHVQHFLQGVQKFDIYGVSHFLTSGISPDTRDEKGLTALMLAARAGCHNIVKLLLDNGADVNAASAYDGLSALHFAVDKGYSEICRVLLDTGASPNAKAQNGLTPLELAQSKGFTEIADILKKAGAR